MDYFAVVRVSGEGYLTAGKLHQAENNLSEVVSPNYNST